MPAGGLSGLAALGHTAGRLNPNPGQAPAALQALGDQGRNQIGVALSLSRSPQRLDLGLRQPGRQPSPIGATAGRVAADLRVTPQPPKIFPADETPAARAPG
jgi:hypothetical protein